VGENSTSPAALVPKLKLHGAGELHSVENIEVKPDVSKYLNVTSDSFCRINTHFLFVSLFKELYISM